MSKKPVPAHSLFTEIKTLIDDGRRNVAVTVNAAMTMLYWQSANASTRKYRVTDGPIMANGLSLRCQSNWCRSMEIRFRKRIFGV
jgi:hypothetical protein